MFSHYVKMAGRTKIRFVTRHRFQSTKGNATFAMAFDLQNMTTADVYAAIEDELEALSTTLEKTLHTDHPFFSQLNSYVLSNPGKRLRPALLFLASKMLDCESNQMLTYAMVYELIHTATLIHDDVIDEAEKRRGLTSLNQVQGNTISVLYGDLLYTKANSLAVAAENPKVLSQICHVTQRMIEGEILQERWNFDLDITERDYFEILVSKTALLFGATLETAGYMAGLEDSARRQLYDYGYHLGVSFQLVDDYLDYAGDANALGKPVLNDLREGKVTLPIIRLLERNHAEIAPLIRRYWDTQEQAVVEQLREAVISHDTLQETWELGRSYAQKAQAFLNDMPNNGYREILSQVPALMLSRVK